MSNTLYEKLLKAYEEHGKIIIATNFNDTLFPFSGDDTYCSYIRELIRKAYDQGNHIIIYTYRGDEVPVKDFCDKENIKYHTFNENVVDLEGQTGKIFYNIFLDDKAGLKEAVHTLEAVLQEIELRKEK